MMELLRELWDDSPWLGRLVFFGLFPIAAIAFWVMIGIVIVQAVS